MGTADFQKRLEKIQAKQDVTYRAARGSSPANSQGASPVGKVLVGVFCGLLGFVSQMVVTFANANYDSLKADYASAQDFVVFVFASTAAALAAFLIFGIWALVTLFAFKRGRIRNVAVASFFIGAAVSALTLNTMSLG